MSKPITVEGRTFKTVKEACIYYNLDYNTVRYRLQRGWSIDEAFELVDIDSKRKTKKITIKGKTFKTVKEACNYYNLEYNTVFVRLRRGWTLEEAFELVDIDSKNKAKEITVEGKSFISIAEAARYYNLNCETVRSRLRNDWSIEEAFELVRKEDNRGEKGRPITLEGKTFKSIKEAAEYYNLDYGTVLQRFNNYGWSIEEAFELVKRKDARNKEITVEGRTFKSIKEACDYYNINCAKIRTRIFNYGWSIEEAFELVKRKDARNKEITVEGKSFISIAEAAEYYNLNCETVRLRLRNGWSIEEAFELVERKRGRS